MPLHSSLGDRVQLHVKKNNLGLKERALIFSPTYLRALSVDITLTGEETESDFFKLRDLFICIFIFDVGFHSVARSVVQ